MTILIVGAMDREIEIIKNEMINQSPIKEETINNFRFYFGKLFDKDIILVKSGVGRVNSALLIATAKLKYEFDYCINIGIAGGIPNLNKNDIIIGGKTVYGDADLSVLDKYVYGQMSGCPVYFEADKYLINTIKNNKILNDNVKFGCICTNEHFTVNLEDTLKLINDHFKEYNILAFDMESCAYAQSCYQLDIPFLSIRFISDIIGSANQVANFVKEEDSIAREKRANNYILELIKYL